MNHSELESCLETVFRVSRCHAEARHIPLIKGVALWRVNIDFKGKLQNFTTVSVSDGSEDLVRVFQAASGVLLRVWKNFTSQWTTIASHELWGFKGNNSPRWLCAVSSKLPIGASSSNGNPRPLRMSHCWPPSQEFVWAELSVNAAQLSVCWHARRRRRV